MNWTAKCPPWESQYSANTHTDAEDCVSESLCHIIYMLTGRRYSPRALAYLSNTTPNGNYTGVVLAAANGGLIPYELWPTPDSFTWETYYAAIPPEVLARGEKLGLSLVPADLDVSPLWTEIAWGAGTPAQESHMVAQIDAGEYFDSELGAPIKPLNYQGATVVWSMSVAVSAAGMLAAQLVGLAAFGSDISLVGKMNVDYWSFEWAKILGAPVDGGLLGRAFPALTGTDRLSLTAGEFAAAVTANA
jgi:hypothetical protein